MNSLKKIKFWTIKVLASIDSPFCYTALQKYVYLPLTCSVWYCKLAYYRSFATPLCRRPPRSGCGIFPPAWTVFSLSLLVLYRIVLCFIMLKGAVLYLIFGDTLLQRTTIFLTYFLFFFRLLDKAVLLSWTTFPFSLNVLTS